jgi:hypothetical protein
MLAVSDFLLYAARGNAIIMVISLQRILSHDKDRVEDDDVSTVAVRLSFAAPIGT